MGLRMPGKLTVSVADQVGGASELDSHERNPRAGALDALSPGSAASGGPVNA